MAKLFIETESDDTSLLKTPYLDILAKTNQEGLKNARLDRKRRNDQVRISNYFRKKFPYSKHDLSVVPERELPMIAKRAKNYFLKRTIGASLWSLASIGGTTLGFACMIAAWEVSYGLFFGGLGIAALAGTSLFFAVRNTVKLFESLIGKTTYYYR